MDATSWPSMIEKVCTLLIFFKIPSNAYNFLLSKIDEGCAHLNNLLISLIGDVVKSKIQLREDKNQVEEKNTRIENLSLSYQMLVFIVMLFG